jgi:predicted amidohydrolase YtcJ
MLDLRDVRGMDAILRAVKMHAQGLPSDAWVIGVGYARGLQVD